MMLFLKINLTKILLSNILAPSARNRQPWKFYILNTLQKNDIMNMLFNWVTLNPNERTSVKGTAKQIRTADKMDYFFTGYKFRIR